MHTLSPGKQAETEQRERKETTSAPLTTAQGSSRPDPRQTDSFQSLPYMRQTDTHTDPYYAELKGKKPG
jgi:hypothetical protein